MNIQDIPSSLHKPFAKLTEDQQETFLSQYKSKRKSIFKTYLFFILLGCHYAYLGKTGLFIAYWITCGGCFLWLIADIFRIPGLVQDYNEDKATQIMQNIKLFDM